MSKLGNLEATRTSLLELAGIVQSTRRKLASLIQEMHIPERLWLSHASSQFSDTLEHLEDVREGFILSQRTSTHGSISELRSLIQHVLIDWNWLQSLGLSLTPGNQIEPLNQQLIVYNHALVALATLPHLPAEAVTFPQNRPSYADVSTPVLPNELLARIEEIEQIIYQADVLPPHKLAYDSFRRTYAFFEASTWLATHHLKPLLGH